MNAFLNNLLVAGKAVKDWAVDNKRSILFWSTNVGFGLTTVLTALETPKAVSMLKGRKAELGVEKLSFKETGKIIIICYWPALTTFLATEACHTGEYKIASRAISSIESSYALTSAALATYKQSIDEVVTPEQKEEIKKKFDEKSVSRIDTRERDIRGVSGDGKEIYTEEITGQLFYHDWSDLQNRMAESNFDMYEEGWLTVNELFDHLGIPIDALAGNELGFSIDDGPIAIYRSSYETFDGRLCWMLRFSVEPKQLRIIKEKHHCYV